MAKKAAKPVRAKTRLRPPVRSGDVPVTAKLLSETKAELKSEITSATLESAAGLKRLRVDMKADLKEEIDSARTELRAEIGSVRTELKAEIGLVRAELKAEIGSVRAELKAEIGSVRTELRAEIGSVRTELKGEIKGLKGDMDRQFTLVHAQFDEMKVQMSDISKATHQMLALYEEQESRNRVVLEAYDQIYRRQDAFETRLTKLEPSS